MNNPNKFSVIKDSENQDETEEQSVPDLKNSKISDLFEDIKSTLDNSIYQKNAENSDNIPENKKSGNKAEIKESGSMSELFDALNSKISTGSNNSPRPRPRAISRMDSDLNSSDEPEKPVKPVKSKHEKKEITDKAAFDEVKSQSKFKSRMTGNKDLFADTKEVPFAADSKKDSDEIDEEEYKIDNIISDEENDDEEDEINITKNIFRETPEETNYDDSDDEIDESFNIYDEEDSQDKDASDIDLELLKAIGIGQETVNAENESESSPELETKKSGKSKIQDNNIKDKPSVKKLPKSLYKITNKEYTDREQIEEIFSSYRKIYQWEFLKMIVGIILFFMLFYMEIAPYLKWSLPSVLKIDYFNLPYIWIDLQILFLIVALNFNSIIYGVKSMFTANINVYSITFFFLLVSVLQTGVTLYMKSNNPDIVLYNAIAAYSLILVSIYNLLDLNAEITSFKTVASKKPKYALNLCNSYKPKAPQSSLLYRSSQPEVDLFAEVVPQSTTVGGILKTPFISNFFSRTYKNKNSGGFIKYFIYISFFAALLMFFITVMIKKETDWYVPLSSVAALMLGSVPLCSFIITSYPVYKAQKKAHSIGSAFIGMNSIEESSEAAVISFYDRDIFPVDQIKTSSIKVYGNNRIDTVLQYLCVVCDKLNLPPADMLKNSTNFDRNFDKNVKFISLDDDGICYISNNRKLFLGTPDYISNTGLIPPYDPNLDPQFIKSSGSIMILASEVEVIAKIYIKYEITADFHDIIKNIKKINACLCIRTFDPNINNDLISRLGNIKKYPIRVLKLKDFADIYNMPEKMDSPLVSKDSLKSLINAVMIAGRTKNVMKSNVLIQTFAFAASLLLAIILGIGGQLAGINSGHLFILQSFWMFPVLVLLGLTP